MKSAVTISLVEEARGGPFVFWHDLPTAIHTAAQLGFDAIEIFPSDPAEIDRADLAAQLEGAGLKLAAMGTGAGWVKRKLHVALPSASDRRAAIDFMRSVVECAASFGAPAIIGSMQGRSSEGVSHGQARDYLREALEELGAFAEMHGVPLIYEPLNRYETTQVNTVDQGITLLKSLRTNNVKLLCDLFHMQIEEVDLGESLRRAGDLVGHVHFVDSNRRPAGCGHIDFAPIISALRAIDYRGYLSAEALPYPDSRGAAERTIAAYRYWTAS